MTIQEDTTSKKWRIASGKVERSAWMHAGPSNNNALRG